MPEVVICKGLPASGKSTWAKEQVAKGALRINKDELRLMLHGGKWSPKNEKEVVEARDNLLRAALGTNKKIIIDDTNLAGNHEKRVRDIVNSWNKLVKTAEMSEGSSSTYTVSVKVFDISVEEAVKRDLKRAASVGRDVIERMYYDHIFAPTPVEYVEGLPYAIIVDLDGTLAEFNGRGPYEFERCEDDHLVQQVYDMVMMYKKMANVTVIIMSGRDEWSRGATTNWLDKHNVPFDHLFMRADDDKRSDDLVKIDLFNNNVRGKYNVRFAIDDRFRVIRGCWNKLGIFVFCVNQNLRNY